MKKKLNIVDWIVLVLVVVVVAALGWKLIGVKKTADAEAKAAAEQSFEAAEHLTYQVVVADVPEAVAQACLAQAELPMADRQLMANGKPVEGYLMDMTAEEAEDGTYTLIATVEASIVEADGIYSVGTQEIRVGKTHILKTYKLELNGQIADVEVPGDD